VFDCDVMQPLEQQPPGVHQKMTRKMLSRFNPLQS
jgi:hypothetical protein